MGEISSGTLGDYVVLQRGTTYQSRLLGLPGPVLLGLSWIARNGGFRSDSLRMYGGESPNKLLLEVGDLFVSLKDVTQTGDLLGSVARVPSSVPLGRLTQDTVKLNLVKDIPAEYLYWILRTEKYRAYCRAHAIGTTNLSLSREDFLNFPIPSPTAERLALVRLLDTLDDKIAVNERIALRCHEIAELHYAVATERARREPLTSLVKPILGATPDRKTGGYWGDGYPWASAKDVVTSKFGLLTATEKSITTAAVEKTRSKPVPKGSVILTARGTVGVVARIGQPMSFNQSCYAFTPDLLPASVLYFTVLRGSRQMQSMAHGTVFSTVNMRTLDHIEVPSLPPEGAASLDEILLPLMDTIEVRMRENQALAQLRDTLLPKLMSGELRVREAEEIVGGAL